MLFWPFRPKCIIDNDMQAWVTQRMGWLAGQFGMETWRMAPAVEPTGQYFPDPYAPNEKAVRCMLDRVCPYMRVDPARVELRLYAETAQTRGAAGLYLPGEKPTVGVSASNLDDPMGVVATIAHELAHVRLLGEGRLTGEEEDMEPLTDLATIFFGFGIFSCNSSFQFKQWTRGTWEGWKARRQGYLSEVALSYALGLWASVRGEERPAWTKHLSLNPRSYVKQTIRFLKANPVGPFA